MRCLWKMFTSFGFLSSYLTTPRTTRPRRCWSDCYKDETNQNIGTLWQGNEDTELTLTREGSYIRSSDDNVEEINIFDGQFNRITFEQVYTKTFKCTYQLQLYPFDTQVYAAKVVYILWSGSGVHGEPNRQDAGDLGDGDHTAHPHHGIRDSAHAIPHHQLDAWIQERQ